MSITDVSHNLGTSLKECSTEIHVQKEETKQFSLEELKSADKKLISLVKKTLKDWNEIAINRLENCKEQYSKRDDKIESDQGIVDEYGGLINDAKNAIQDFVSPNEKSLKRRIFVLIRDRQMQGLLCLSVRLNDVCINVLMSAPWNIPMYGNLSKDHEALRVKGVGTTLMRVAYTTAQELKMDKLRLLCLPGSYSFYKDHIGMRVVNEQGDEEENFWEGWHVHTKFELDVSAEIPNSLSKNTIIMKSE